MPVSIKQVLAFSNAPSLRRTQQHINSIVLYFQPYYLCFNLCNYLELIGQGVADERVLHLSTDSFDQWQEMC